MQRVLVWFEKNNNDHDLKSTRPRNAEAEVLKNWGFWIPFIWNTYYHFIILQVKLGIIRHDIELTKCISLNVSWLLLRGLRFHLTLWPTAINDEIVWGLKWLTESVFSVRPILESEPPWIRAAFWMNPSECIFNGVKFWLLRYFLGLQTNLLPRSIETSE